MASWPHCDPFAAYGPLWETLNKIIVLPSCTLNTSFCSKCNYSFFSLKKLLYLNDINYISIQVFATKNCESRHEYDIHLNIYRLIDQANRRRDLFMFLVASSFAHTVLLGTACHLGNVHESILPPLVLAMGYSMFKVCCLSH